MLKSRILTIALMIAFAAPSGLLGQTRGYGQRETRKPKPRVSSGFNARAARYRPSSYLTTGYAGFVLRSEQLRAELAHRIRNDRVGLLESPLPSGDPVTNMLEYRNALRARSGLAIRSTALVGRQDYIFQNGVWAGAVKNLDLNIATPATLTMRKATGEPPLPKGDSTFGVTPNLDGSFPTGSYNDVLAARLEERSQDYLRMGMALYRQKKYMEAAGYFDLYGQAKPESVRCLTLKTLCAYQQRDYNSALLLLIQTMKQIEKSQSASLDDAWFNWQDLYEKQQDFARLVNEATLIAKSPGSSSRFGLMMAYFQWLSGDTNTAISAMDAAIDAMQKESAMEDVKRGAENPIDRTSFAKRFRDLLMASKSAPVPAPSSADLPAPGN